MESNLSDFTAVVKLLSDVATVVIIQYGANTDTSTAAQTAFAGLVAPHRFLFCKSEIGKIALVRQLCPNVHIEYETHIAEQLCAHVRVVQLRGFAGGSNAGVNISTTTATAVAGKKSVWKTISTIRDLLR
jgi:hypothetical protein